MISTKGIYHKGKLELEEPINSEKPIKVIVTFLEDEVVEEKSIMDKFNFAKARKLLANVKGNLSDAVIEERREAKY